VLEAKIIGISLPARLTWTSSRSEWVLLLHILVCIRVGIVLWVLIGDRVVLLLNDDHACSKWIVSHSTHELLVCVEVLILVLEVLVHSGGHLLHHWVHLLSLILLLLVLEVLVHSTAHLLHHGVLLRCLSILVVVLRGRH